MFVYQLYVSAIPDAFSWELLGDAYRQKGNWEEALNCYTKALEHNPEHKSAVESLGKMRVF